jgi:hypothetical protein
MKALKKRGSHFGIQEDSHIEQQQESYPAGVSGACMVGTDTYGFSGF